MWESPIKITEDITRQMDMEIENGIMTAVRKVGIDVNKEELLKALQYDRGQYEKGYQDGLNANKWIPCSERLPQTHEDTKSSDVVLVCGYDKKIDFSWQAMGFYVNTNAIKRWFFAECKDTETPIDWIDIIAWMPLPEPYKGE